MKIVGLVLLLSNISLAGDFSGFESQVNSFIVAGKHQGIKINTDTLKIQLTDELSTGDIGMCFTSTNTVLVSNKFWNKLSPINKQYVIWHELGHCILNRQHNTVLLFGGHPRSIMYPDNRLMYDKQWYKDHFSDLERELFHPEYYK